MSDKRVAQCAFCGDSFQLHRKYSAACCSVPCSNRYRRLRPLQSKCAHCQASFAPKKPSSRFCSGSCSAFARTPGTETDRFWSRVDKTDSCWLWTGSLNWDGYGQTRFLGATRRANRVAWYLEHGRFPDEGIHVLHSCDNPRCVRTEHLFLGTHADNMADMARKGRWYLRFAK